MASETGSGPGKWLVNRVRPKWPWKLEQAGKALFWCPGDARRGLKAIAACGSSGWGMLGSGKGVSAMEYGSLSAG